MWSTFFAAMRLELELYVSPYCERCASLAAELHSAGAKRGLRLTIRRRDVLEHMEAAVAAGVRTTPALVHRGKLLVSGGISHRRLSELLDNLAREMGDEGLQHR